MSTKKKTTKKTTTTATKRTPTWWATYNAAITGLANAAAFENTDGAEDPVTEITDKSAFAVRMAEKIADIATARNS